MPTRARLEHSPGGESRVWWDGAGMGGKHRVAQPCTHSQPSQPRRLLCKELFTPGLGRCFISTVRYSAHIAPHCQNLGAGSLCVVGDQPGEVWLCPLQSRVLAGGAGLGLSPATSQARQSKKRHFSTNLPCLYRVTLLAGVGWGLSTLGWGTEPIPRACPGWESCPRNIFLGCSNPQQVGTEAGAVRAVYQPSRNIRG